MNEKNDKRAYPIELKGWDKVIYAVRTPLAYAVFAGLSGLLILSMGVFGVSSERKNLLINSSLIIIFLSIAYVFIISAIRPEALRGERLSYTQPKEDKTKNVSDPQKGTLPNSAKLGIKNIGFFEDFVNLFPEHIQSSKTITTMFIHSRRWRENNNAIINQFLVKERAKIVAFLPDLKNEELIMEIKRHFDDGDHIEFFISDAFRYYSSLKSRFPEKIDVRCYSLYQTYSFYKFDDSAIFAMYPNTAKRRSVPAVEITSDGDFWDFLGDDIDVLFDTCNSLTATEIKHYSQLNTREGGAIYARVARS